MESPTCNFAGTGYLGLQGHHAVVPAAIDGCRRFGVHTATIRARFGGCPPVVEVEARAARFLEAEAGRRRDVRKGDDTKTDGI
jgi:7-keto-8-aminopelargonate synthetase-like enzyme